MSRYTFSLNEEEMRDLAEMGAMVLSALGRAMPDLRNPRAVAWQQLCVRLMEKARSVPSLQRDMEMNPDCGHWFFKRAYLEESFCAELLDELSDHSFWEELVTRMADQSLRDHVGETGLEQMDAEERERLLSSMETALWNEVRKRGIDRLAFLLPPEEC